MTAASYRCAWPEELCFPVVRPFVRHYVYVRAEAFSDRLRLLFLALDRT